VRKTLRGLSATQRANVVRKLTQTAFSFAGLKGATLVVAPDGKRVDVSIPPTQACSDRLASPAAVERVIRGTVQGLAQVRVMVERTSQSLAAYAATHCKSLSPPSLPGNVLLSQNGTGQATTRAFHVTSSRWTLAYNSAGNFFQVFAFKGKAPEKDAIALTKSGQGRHTFHGPGTFKLQIAGAGDWAIRVVAEGN
jgi:hypothetical protein